METFDKDEAARELADVPTCSHCGSTAVGVDATALWDRVAGDWSLGSTHDAAFCDDCDGETSLVWKRL